jgi:hypothetical protein
MMRKIIVTGGREYKDEKVAFQALDWAFKKFDIGEVIQGGATGADSLARKWGKDRGMWVTTMPAQWKLFGKAAGPIRNLAMVAGNKDAACLMAFPGGRGTDNCIACALKAKIPVYIVSMDGVLHIDQVEPLTTNEAPSCTKNPPL